MEVDRKLYERLRRRMLMFYFMAGINLFMGLAVLTAGPGSIATANLAVIVLVFLGFAAVNVYIARMLKKQWDQHMREQQDGVHR